MFITEKDYKTVIGDNALRVISQTSQEVRTNAEYQAQEEIASYLRPRYDTQAVFAAQEDNRNRLIVMIMCDIALYHMAAALPQKMGPDIRKERYERALKTLEGIQAGKILPDLPQPQPTTDGSSPSSLNWAAEPKLNHYW